MSSPVSDSTTDLLRSSIVCTPDSSCLVESCCQDDNEFDTLDVDKIITDVYQELPPGKYHESERLWEILHRLHVVDDNEVPDFVTALATPSTSSSSTSSDTSSTESSTSSTSAEPQADANPFSSFVKGFQNVLSELNDFTGSEEGKTIMSQLPGGFGDNITGAVKELNEKGDENPLAKILGMFTSN